MKYLLLLLLLSQSLLFGIPTAGDYLTISRDPITLQPLSGNSTPQLALSPNGMAFVVWDNSINNNRSIQGAFFNPNLTTGTPTGWIQFGTIAINAQAPVVGIDASGNAFIAWVNVATGFTNVSTSQQIFVTRYDAASNTFSSAVALSQAGKQSFAPSLAVSLDGDALVVWNQNIPKQVLASSFTRVLVGPTSPGFWTGPVTFQPQIPSSLQVLPPIFALDGGPLYHLPATRGIAILQTANGLIQAARIFVP